MYHIYTYKAYFKARLCFRLSDLVAMLLKLRGDLVNNLEPQITAWY